MVSYNFLRVIFTIIFTFLFKDIVAQYSKSHYIPPVTTQAMGGASSPCQQYLYISTPSEIPINVTIKHIGGITQSNNVSNNEPWSYYIGTGDNTNLIIKSANISSTPFSDKGFIIESEGLIYASARLFSCANDGISPGYQAAALVSKGNAV